MPTPAELQARQQPDPQQVIIDNLHSAGAVRSDLFTVPEEVDLLYVEPSGVENDYGRYVLLIPPGYKKAQVGAVIDEWEALSADQRRAGIMIVERPSHFVWTDDEEGEGDAEPE